MRLRTFDGDIPLTAGSFLLQKASKDRYKDLLKSWFANSTTASFTFTQANKALQQRITDITKTNSELKDTIESMSIKESKNKFVMIDKFVRLLNHKKQKIYTLEQQVRTLNEKLTEAKEEAKKRKRDIDAQEATIHITNERAVKVQRTVKNETTSLPLPAVDNDSDDDFFGSDGDIDCAQTVR
ncbi:hypothetical protein BD408DRAFT_96817 [Parasitella parasitica]|nr:hypothetical protein BD408DRAFT_96817 [Parasitella parasitica]